MEEAVDLLSGRSTHHELQLGGGGVAELLDAGEALQQVHGFDPADPGDLLDQGQDDGVQQPGGARPPERVLPAVPVDLDRNEWFRTGSELLLLYLSFYTF